MKNFSILMFALAFCLFSQEAMGQDKPTVKPEQPKFTPLDISDATTVASTRIFNQESLVFPQWGKQTHHGIPFMVIDPDGGKTKNAICLHSALGAISSKMPRTVRLGCDLSAKEIHILGAAGWGVPWFQVKNTLSMVMRVEYADGDKEDHQVINGVHLTDWAKGPDVPGSKNIGVSQVRYFSIVPKRQDAVIRAIEFRKGTDKTSPLVMALTFETPVIQVAQNPKDQPAKRSPPKDDKAILQGRWYAVSEESNGKAQSRDELLTMNKILVVSGDEFRMERGASGKRVAVEGKMTLGQTDSPKAFYFEGKVPSGQRIELHGVYDLSDSMFKLCYTVAAAGAKDTRPVEFRTFPGSGRIFVTFKRSAEKVEVAQTPKEEPGTKTKLDEEREKKEKIAAAERERREALAKAERDKIKAADDKTPPQPPAQEKEIHDPVVEKLIKVTSTKYTDLGFKKYVFGQSQNEIEKLSALDKPSDSYRLWRNNKKMMEDFCFENKKLVGFIKTYRNDNEGYLKAAVEQFGQPSKDSVLLFELRGTEDYFGGFKSTKHYTEAHGYIYYFFPKTVVAVKVINHQHSWAPRPPDPDTPRTEKGEFLSICVMDRAYVRKPLNDHVKVMREGLQWCKTVIEQANKNGTWDTRTVPKYPRENTVTSVINKKLWVKPKEMERFSGGEFVSGEIPSSGKDEDTAFLVRVSFNPTSLYSSKSFTEGVGISKGFPFAYHSLKDSPFDEMLGRCNASLAQEYFPATEGSVGFVKVRDMSIRADPTGKAGGFQSTHDLCYQWESKDGTLIWITTEGVTIQKRAVKKKKTLD